MFGFREHTNKVEFWGRSEYGETVSVSLIPRDEPDTFDLILTLQGREPKNHRFLAQDAEFLGNKLQLKGPFLRIVLDYDTAEKLRGYMARKR